MARPTKAYIAGVYEHPTRKAVDKTIPQLHAELAAGALADAMDVVAFASSPGLRTAARVGGAAVAAGAAAVGILAAREITRD